MNVVATCLPGTGSFVTVPPHSANVCASPPLPPVSLLVKMPVPDSHSAEAERATNAINARLVASLFSFLKMHAARLHSTGPTNQTKHLDIALVLFLKHVCTAFLSQVGNEPAKMVYAALAQKPELGIQGPEEVLEITVEKILMMLKFYPRDRAIYGYTLGASGLLWTLSTKFSSSKLMGKNKLVAKILREHTDINLGDDPRTRVSFYRTIGRLLFAQKTDVTFSEFVAPLAHQLSQVMTHLTANANDAHTARRLLTQVMLDLRGLVSSIFSSSGGYVRFFEWFYTETKCYEWLVKVMEQASPLQLERETVWTIMKFVAELVHNHHSRIVFPITSANGTILFRTTSLLLIEYAKWLGSGVMTEMDDYFKSAKYFLDVANSLMGGGYANFGVFEVYNDPLLDNLLKCICTLLFNLDIPRCSMYPKVLELVYDLFSKMLRSFPDFFICLDHNWFAQVWTILLRGLQLKSTPPPPCLRLTMASEEGRD